MPRIRSAGDPIGIASLLDPVAGRADVPMLAAPAVVVTGVMGVQRMNATPASGGDPVPVRDLGDGRWGASLPSAGRWRLSAGTFSGSRSDPHYGEVSGDVDVSASGVTTVEFGRAFRMSLADAVVAPDTLDTRPATAPPSPPPPPDPTAGSVVVRVSRETITRGVGGVGAFMRRATSAMEPPAPEVQLAARDAQLGGVEFFGAFPAGAYVLTVRRQVIMVHGQPPPPTDVRTANVTITTGGVARFAYTGDALTNDAPSAPPGDATDAVSRRASRVQALASAHASADFILLHFWSL